MAVSHGGQCPELLLGSGVSLDDVEGDHGQHDTGNRPTQHERQHEVLRAVTAGRAQLVLENTTSGILKTRLKSLDMGDHKRGYSRVS